LGGDLGPHDGTDWLELQLDAAAGAGEIIVVSAGNSADDSIHSSGSVPLSGSATIAFTVSASSPQKYYDIWYDGTDTMDARVNRPNDGPTSWVGPGLTQTFVSGDGTVKIEGEWLSPDNNDHEILITLTGPVTSTGWSIELRRNASSTGDGSFHAWTASGRNTQFTSGVTADYTVNSPATALNVIAVGAYVTKTSWTNANGTTSSYPGAPPVGEITVFSSRGPTRDARQKPELTAPGMGIASALSSSLSVDNTLKADDGVHWVTQGTSMSAPHVAGTVALMLYRDHDATPDDVRSTLQSTCRTDSYTGSSSSLPDTVWGYGKADALAATSSTPTAILAHLLGLDSLAPGLVRLRWEVPMWANVAACRPAGSLDCMYPCRQGPHGAEYELVLPMAAAHSTQLELVGPDGSVRWRGQLWP
jgi:hypothetical protein